MRSRRSGSGSKRSIGTLYFRLNLVHKRIGVFRETQGVDGEHAKTGLRTVGHIDQHAPGALKTGDNARAAAVLFKGPCHQGIRRQRIEFFQADFFGDCIHSCLPFRFFLGGAGLESAKTLSP